MSPPSDPAPVGDAEAAQDASTIVFTVADDVATVVLNRPAKRNAMDAAMAVDLAAVLDDLQGARALVLTGDLRAFSAGADLSAMRTDADESPSQKWRPLLRRLAALPLPTIAAIEGWCLGGGLELAMTFDLRVASCTAQLGLPEVTRGIYAGGGGVSRLPRLIGPTRGKQLLFTGKPIDGVTACDWGLVNEVVEEGQALARATELARELARGATRAIAVIKGIVDDGAGLPVDAALDLEEARGALLAGSVDSVEGIRAFMERRPAQFVGR